MDSIKYEVFVLAVDFHETMLGLERAAMCPLTPLLPVTSLPLCSQPCTRAACLCQWPRQDLHLLLPSNGKCGFAQGLGVKRHVEQDGENVTSPKFQSSEGGSPASWSFAQGGMQGCCLARSSACMRGGCRQSQG